MKTIIQKTGVLRVFFIISLLTASFQLLAATNYQTFYLDNLNYQDTVVYCLGNDSIKLIRPSEPDGISNWYLNFSRQDTFFLDYIVLPVGFEGWVTYDLEHVNYDLYITTFKVNAGKDTTLVCGGTLQLSATSNYTGDGNLSYSWSPTNGLNDPNIYNPRAIVTSETHYIVTTSMEGCEPVDDTIIVNISPLSINAGQDQTTVCGGTLQLSATSNYTGDGNLSYSWSPTNGLNDPNIYNPRAIVTSDSEYKVTASLEGCESANDTIFVSTIPLSVNAGQDITTVCGGTVQLSATSNYTGDGNLSYSWIPTDGLNDPAISNPTTTLTSEANYIVTTSIEGCESATDEINVFLKPMGHPFICIVGVDSTNKNVVIWDKTESTLIASFYLYKETNVTGVYEMIKEIPYNETSIYVDVSSNPEIQSNKYKISIKDICGLETEQSPFHKTMHLSLNQGQNNTWNLIWESYEGFTVSTYNIYRGTHPSNMKLIGTSSSSNTQYSDFSAPEGYVYYQIEIISPNACNPFKKSSSLIAGNNNVSRSNFVTNNPQGVNIFSPESRLINFYPNPANNIIHIEGLQNRSIGSIYNANGQMVLTSEIGAENGEVNVSGLPSGLYILKMNIDDEVLVKRFTKE